jgi:hypothetical protein
MEQFLAYHPQARQEARIDPSVYVARAPAAEKPNKARGRYMKVLAQHITRACVHVISLKSVS